MRSSLLLVSWLLGSLMSHAVEPEIEWVKVGEARLKVGWVFKVYDAAYFVQKGTSAEASVLADVGKRLELTYLRDIPREQFIKAADDLMAGYLTEAARAPLADRLDEINRAYQDVKKGDTYTLEYTPGKGTVLSLNGKVQVVIPGADFGREYFRIWTDPACAYEAFRNGIMGK